MRSQIVSSLAFLTILLVACWGVMAQGKKRAAPPKFDASANDAFFNDIFGGGVLSGERPANLGTPSGSGTQTNAVTGNSVPGTPMASAGVGNWSKIISASTIEDEVKATKKLVDLAVTTPTDFAGKGYKLARRDFTTLASMFGIIAEYDGEVRWKSEAVAGREMFGRTAGNCKVGSQQAFAEAKLRKTEIGDLVNGQGLNAKETFEANADWSKVAGRGPLMMRLEMALEPRIQQWTADEKAFKENAEQILHEAEVIAALGELLMKPNMEDAAASEYKAFCEQIKKAALDTAAAVKGNNAEAARKAVGAINKACTDCHENYRS